MHGDVKGTQGYGGAVRTAEGYDAVSLGRQQGREFSNKARWEGDPRKPRVDPLT